MDKKTTVFYTKNGYATTNLSVTFTYERDVMKAFRELEILQKKLGRLQYVMIFLCKCRETQGPYIGKGFRRSWKVL